MSATATHPAAERWLELCGVAGRQPPRIETIKAKKKSSVYRLIGARPDGGAVIAKRTRRPKALVEQVLYEEVLPHIAVPSLRWYGQVEEPEATPAGHFCWLFLEDIGDERYSPFSASQRQLVAAWLGELHASAPDLSGPDRLPDRGPDHYWTYVERALELAPRMARDARIPEAARPTFEAVAALLEIVASRWADVEATSKRFPRTVVHGDFLAKNVHVRHGRSGEEVVAFDWGNAGWGLPATDLGQSALPCRGRLPSAPDFGAYLEAVRGRGVDFDLDDVRELANLGQLFWAVTVVARELPGLEDGWASVDKVSANVRAYRGVLAEAVRRAGWTA